jgi:hypothetical protein
MVRADKDFFRYVKVLSIQSIKLTSVLRKHMIFTYIFKKINKV